VKKIFELINKMHQVLTKTLLVLSVILAVVALATPDWVQSTVGGSKSNSGLFQKCAKSDSSHDKCTTMTKDDDTKNKDLEVTRGLMISAVVLLVISLACEFIPVKDMKMCPLLSAGALVLGMIMMVAALSVYGVKIFKPAHDAGGSNVSYGYSYWLAVGALVLAVLAGLSAVLTQGRTQQLRKGLIKSRNRNI
jgi:hypothetical protein